MDTITVKRAGELLRSIFEILWKHPDGLATKEILLRIPQVIRLTEEELSISPNTGIPQYEKAARISTIPVVKIGWLAKDGRELWRITQEGYNSCGGFTNVHDFYQEALRLYAERRRETPENALAIEIAQESAWSQIKKRLYNLSHHELQTMTAELLRAMNYYPSWVIPLDMQPQKIHLIAYSHPMGIKGERILVQIIHKGQAVTLEGVKSFVSLLGQNEFGMLISIGGFTNEAMHELNLGHFQKIRALNAVSFFDLWETHYIEMREEIHRILPLKAVNFLSASG